MALAKPQLAPGGVAYLRDDQIRREKLGLIAP
jgi:hypothetical protein